jgi:hypothetical protein
MNNDKTFMTRDLAAATWIAYNNVKFAAGYDKKTKSWVFDDPDKCKDLDLKLRNGEALSEVLKYESTRRNLLGMCRDAGDSGNNGKNSTHS